VRHEAGDVTLPGVRQVLVGVKTDTSARSAGTWPAVPGPAAVLDAGLSEFLIDLSEPVSSARVMRRAHSEALADSAARQVIAGTLLEHTPREGNGRG
jgi:hypothetical protein